MGSSSDVTICSKMSVSLCWDYQFEEWATNHKDLTLLSQSFLCLSMFDLVLRLVIKIHLVERLE